MFAKKYSTIFFITLLKIVLLFFLLLIFIKNNIICENLNFYTHICDIYFINNIARKKKKLFIFTIAKILRMDLLM